MKKGWDITGVLVARDWDHIRLTSAAQVDQPRPDNNTRTLRNAAAFPLLYHSNDDGPR